MTKILVVGLGYIGLPTAALFANNGYDVVGLDNNPSLVETVKNGSVHIEEPGLSTLVAAAYNAKKITAVTKPEEADVFIVAVPTPITKDKKADLSCLISAVNSIIPVLRKGNLVILESTVPPKTTQDIILPLLEKTGLELGSELLVAHCPERVLPGSILKELIANDRVIGGINNESALQAKKLYEVIVEGKIYTTDSTTAEIVKLAENTFRDVNIGLANELAQICYQQGVNVWEVMQLANRHPRVDIHNPGPGVGGHCLAVDPYFLIETINNETSIIAQGRNVNEGMPLFVSKVVAEQFPDIKQGKVAIFGVTYKGNVNDTRESPAIKVIELLLKLGYKVKIYDPHVNKFQYEVNSLEETIEKADLIIILADHREFKYLDPKKVGNLMRNRNVFDTKNCVDHSDWENAGFKLKVIGKS